MPRLFFYIAVWLPLLLFVLYLPSVAGEKEDLETLQQDELKHTEEDDDAPDEEELESTTEDENRNFEDESIEIIPQVSFKPGEYFHFTMRYGSIKAGVGTMVVKPNVMIGKRKCFHIHASLRSTGIFAVFHKVEDEFDTYIDAERFHPLVMVKDIHERRYIRYKVYDFHHDEEYVHYCSRREKKSGDKFKEYSMDFPSVCGVQDELSSLYYLRGLNLEPGEKATVWVQAGRSYHGIDIHAIKKERITTDLGEFDTILYQPVVKFKSRVLKEKKNRLFIWITDDSRRWPVLIKVKAMIGHVTAELDAARVGK